MPSEGSIEVPRLPRPQGARAWGVAAGLAVAAVLAQLPIFDRNFVPLDEGHLALTASRLLDGDVLYRDLHTGIFPGIYAVTAALFAIFGQELLVTRVAQVGVNAATAALLWTIGLRIVPMRWALLPPLGFLALIWISFPVLSMFNYSALSGLLAMAALLAALRLLEGGRSADGLGVGLLVAGSLFTKQNYGVLAAAALAGALLWLRPRSALAGRSPAATLGPALLAGGGFAGLVLAWLASVGALGDWLDSTLLSLVGSQLEHFDNPMPPILGRHPEGDLRFVYLYVPSALFDYLVRGDRFLGLELTPDLVGASIRLAYGLPVLALVGACARLARIRARVPAAPAAVVVFAGVFFFGIFPSAIFSHLVYVLAPVLLLCAWLGHELERVLPRAAARSVAAAAWTAVVLTLAACATIPPHVRASYSSPSRLPHVGIRTSESQAELHAAALDFIDGCAAPGEPVFVLPVLPILYLASGHPNPVKWDLLIPGAIDEEEIARALERRRVRCIVRQREMSPEFPALAALYPRLDGYIRSHYGPARVLTGGDQRWLGLVRTTPFRAPPGASSDPGAAQSRRVTAAFEITTASSRSAMRASTTSRSPSRQYSVR